MVRHYNTSIVSELKLVPEGRFQSSAARISVSTAEIDATLLRFPPLISARSARGSSSFLVKRHLMVRHYI